MSISTAFELRKILCHMLSYSTAALIRESFLLLYTIDSGMCFLGYHAVFSYIFPNHRITFNFSSIEMADESFATCCACSRPYWIGLGGKWEIVAWLLTSTCRCTLLTFSLLLSHISFLTNRGFSVHTGDRHQVFKPSSVQSMW